MAKATEHWSGKTDGTPWMLRSLVAMFRYVDVRVLYCGMAVVIPFYMLFCRQGYLASYHFFRRIGCSPLRSFFKVYLHQFTFGQVILDRFAAYAGQKYRMEIFGRELFSELAEGSEGFLLAGAHVGSYELAGYSLVSRQKHIYALVYGGEAETVMENRRRMFADTNITMVAAKPDMSHVFTLNNALAEGNIVSMPSDRLFGSARYVECDFLGKARFPLGPFAMAAQRQLPILAVFVMRRAYKHYHVYVHRIDGPADQPRIRDRAEAMARQFAAHLETVVRLYPTQWFNFYDFWNDKG